MSSTSIEPSPLNKRDKRLLLSFKVAFFTALTLLWGLFFSDAINTLAFFLLWTAAFVTWVLVRPLLPRAPAKPVPPANAARAARKSELEERRQEIGSQLAAVKSELAEIADEEYQEQLRQDDWLTRNWLRSYERLERKSAAAAYVLAVVVLVGLAYTMALAFGWSEFQW